MFRKALLVCAALLVAPALLDAYTVVLRDGRRIEAQSRYSFEGNLVRFVGNDGQVYRLPPTQVDFEATFRANNPNAKIWTNDDLQQLGGAPISVVGSGRRATATTAEGATEATEGAGEGETTSEPALEDTAEYWQQKVKALYEQIDEIDQQAQRLRSGQNRAASNSVSLQDDAAGVEVADTLRRLERRKQDLQQRIREVELQAKRKGVAPGKLRRNVVMRAEPR